MKLGVVNTTTQTQAILDVIDDVNLFISVDRDAAYLQWDYWLGTSPDGILWAMFAIPSADEVEDDEDIVAEKYFLALFWIG